MKGSVTKEENQTKQEKNIYNHNRKKLYNSGWSHIYVKFFFLFQTNEDEIFGATEG